MLKDTFVLSIENIRSERKHLNSSYIYHVSGNQSTDMFRVNVYFEVTLVRMFEFLLPLKLDVSRDSEIYKIRLIERPYMKIRDDQLVV